MAAGPSGGAHGVSAEGLRALVSGRSALDLQRLDVASFEDAEAFLRSYGFDYHDAGARRELQAVRRGALEFIESRLLVPGLEVLPQVREMYDVRRLLWWASASDGSPRQRWSCALLRVMHVYIHSHSYADVAYGQLVRQAIGERFAPHLFRVDGALHLGDRTDSVELISFAQRPDKTHDRVMIKLLAAVENVATEVYDRQGVRIVTHDAADALRVVDYLDSRRVVMPANAMPSRSRNTLIDPDAGATPDRKASDHNAFSDEDYRSIQFTCRQLLRVPGGRIFFPYEVQILDAESLRTAQAGKASHEAYRARQRAAARRRVLGPLLP